MTHIALAIPSTITIADQYESHQVHLAIPLKDIQHFTKGNEYGVTLSHFTNNYRITLEIILTGSIIQRSSLNTFIKQTLETQLTHLPKADVDVFMMLIKQQTNHSYNHLKQSLITTIITAYDKALIEYKSIQMQDYPYLQDLFGQRNYYINSDGIFLKQQIHPITQ